MAREPPAFGLSHPGHLRGAPQGRAPGHIGNTGSAEGAREDPGALSPTPVRGSSPRRSSGQSEMGTPGTGCTTWMRVPWSRRSYARGVSVWMGINRWGFALRTSSTRSLSGA